MDEVSGEVLAVVPRILTTRGGSHSREQNTLTYMYIHICRSTYAYLHVCILIGGIVYDRFDMGARENQGAID